MLTSKSKRILMRIGYAAFFVFAFLLFAYWTFPYDRVRDYIVLQVEDPMGPDGRRHPSGYELEINDLSPSFLTGVEMDGVRFAKAPQAPGDPPVDVTMRELDARVSVLSLLGGNLGLTFDATIGGGEIEGSYDDSDAQTHVVAQVHDVNLHQLGILRALVGLPIAGVANGNIDLTVAEKLKDTAGNVSLDVKHLAIGDGHAKLALPGMRDGLTIPRISAGDMALRADVTDGVARIARLHAAGKDAQLDGSGTVRLLRPLRMARLDMMMRVKFSDALRNRNDKTRAIFSLLDFNPQLRAARTPDGWLQYRLDGSLGSRIRPTPAGHARPPGIVR